MATTTLKLVGGDTLRTRTTRRYIVVLCTGSGPAIDYRTDDLTRAIGKARARVGAVVFDTETGAQVHPPEDS
jgi:hypothetical protein